MPWKVHFERADSSPRLPNQSSSSVHLCAKFASSFAVVSLTNYFIGKVHIVLVWKSTFCLWEKFSFVEHTGEKLNFTRSPFFFKELTQNKRYFTEEKKRVHFLLTGSSHTLFHVSAGHTRLTGCKPLHLYGAGTELLLNWTAYIAELATCFLKAELLLISAATTVKNFFNTKALYVVGLFP
jgi:hypothetical protein